MSNQNESGMNENTLLPEPQRGTWMKFIPYMIALWLFVLAMLTLFTSNPMTVNVRQLLSADQLWHTKILDLTHETVEVKTNLSRENEPVAVFRVQGLNRSHCQQGREYLMPVIPNENGEYEVVPVKIKETDYYPIYEWTPENETRVKEILINKNGFTPQGR